MSNKLYFKGYYGESDWVCNTDNIFEEISLALWSIFDIASMDENIKEQVEAFGYFPAYSGIDALDVYVNLDNGVITIEMVDEE